MLTSYINKRKLSKKNVIDLSSMHDSIKVTKNQRKKPSVHAIYDYTNVGVVANLLSTSHSTCILWMLLHLFMTPVDQMPRLYCKIMKSRCLILHSPTVFRKHLYSLQSEKIWKLQWFADENNQQHETVSWYQWGIRHS